MLRRPRITVALAALAVALAVPAGLSAANNPAASGTLSSQADYVTAASITVYITAECAPWFFNTTPPSAGAGFASVSVNQATSPSTGGFGSGSTTFTCDGQNHKLAITVGPGPWQLGTALANWEVCGFSCVFGTKQIKIS